MTEKSKGRVLGLKSLEENVQVAIKSKEIDVDKIQ